VGLLYDTDMVLLLYYYCGFHYRSNSNLAAWVIECVNDLPTIFIYLIIKARLLYGKNLKKGEYPPDRLMLNLKVF